MNEISKAKGYEKLYNNFLENCYLDILLIIKDPQETFKIITKTVERVLVFDYLFDNLMNLKDKIQRYAVQQIKNYVMLHYDEISKKDLSKIDFSFPPKLYLLNFQIHKLFNELDNQILVEVIIFKKDIKDLVLILHYDADFILKRLHLILRQIRLIFLETIKNELKEDE